MTTLELLTIPGLDNSKQLTQMRIESSKRAEKAVRSQLIAAKVMSSRKKSLQGR